MKAQTTINLSDGSEITIHSPNVVGEIDRYRLARILDGEDTRTVLPDGLSLPQGFGDRSEFISIPINDAPLGETRYFTSVFVTEWPLRAQVVAGAVFQRSGEKWHVGAGICDDLSKKEAPAFLIQEPSFVVSANLVIRELQQYLWLAPKLNRLIDARIAREVQSRCNLFNERGLEGFFSDDRSFRLWRIASSWSDWEDRGLSVAQRLNELKNGEPAIEMDALEFGGICEIHGLKILNCKKPMATLRKGRQKAPRRPPPKSCEELFTFLRGCPADSVRFLSEFADDEELKTIFSGGGYDSREVAATLSDKEFALIKDWNSEADSVFSYGGTPEISYDDSQISPSFCATSEPVSVRQLIDHIWWWKAVMNDFVGATTSLIEGPIERAAVQNTKNVRWDEHALDLFYDNWQQSAFFYELRARYGGRYKWDPFGKPWVKLNFTERGILACFWPVKHVGTHRIQPKLSPVVLQKMKSQVAIRLNIDLRAPSAKAQEQLLQQIENSAAKAGFSIPGRGEGRRMKLSWLSLQHLDLEHFLGKRFAKNETNLKNVFKEYEGACSEIGIAP